MRKYILLLALLYTSALQYPQQKPVLKEELLRMDFRNINTSELEAASKQVSAMPAAISDSSSKRISPLLRQVLTQYNKTARSNMTIPGRAMFSINGSPGQEMLGILVKSYDTEAVKNLITARGGLAGAAIGGIITASVPATLITELSRLPYVIYIDISLMNYPFMDKSMKEIKADKVHAGEGLPYPVKGEGVIVGVLDSGIDWKHDDFMESGQSRLLYLWDMSGQGNPPAGYNYGTEYSKSQIKEGTCNESDSDDGHGHGTHVAGTAAGNGSILNSHTGLAPESDIIFVKGFRNSPGFASNDVVNGCNYIFSKGAEAGKPVVINLSLGGHIGAHDGSSLYEQALAGMVGDGKLIIAAAGNEGEDYIHLGYAAHPDSLRISYYAIFSGTDMSVIDLWYDQGSIELFIAAVDNNYQLLASSPYVKPGEILQNYKMQKDNSVYGYVTIDATNTSDPNNNSKEVLIINHTNNDTNIDISGVIWVLCTRGNGNLDAWGNKLLFFPFSSSSVRPGDNIKSSGIPSTSKKVISVGAYVTKNEWDCIDNQHHQWTDKHILDPQHPTAAVLGQKACFSSMGPTRDGRLTPVISAPGEIIVSAFSSFLTQNNGYQRSELIQGGRYRLMEGTSMAAPHVTGLTALMLQVDPKLDYEDMIEIFSKTGRSDNFTGSLPNYSFGYGKINALAAIQELAGSSSTKAVASSDKNSLSIEVQPGAAGTDFFNLSNTGTLNLNYNVSISHNLQKQSSGFTFDTTFSPLFSTPAISSGMPEYLSPLSGSCFLTDEGKALPGEFKEFINDDGNDNADTFLGYNDSTGLKALNRFALTEDFVLEKLRFFFKSENSENKYDIGILDQDLKYLILGRDIKFNPSPDGAWHTVSLMNPISFKSGNQFYIYVFANNTANYPAGTDVDAQVPGQSYFAHSSSTQITNLNTVSGFENAAFLIRAIGSTQGSANQQPVARAVVSSASAKVNELITFDASGSYDPDGTIASYTWDIQGAGIRHDKVFTYSFSTPGTYTYLLTVLDDKGASGSASGSIIITADEGPRFTVNPATGVLLPGASGPVSISFNSKGIPEGNYQAEVRITGNCQTVSIPLSIRISTTVDVKTETAAEKGFYLWQNYPNPFNPSTSIAYSVPVGCSVSLRMYDVLGREVASVEEGFKSPGTYNVQFNASTLPSGIYFYRLQAGSYSNTMKLSLIR